MAINLDDKGLNFVVNKFDLFFIDIWGVIHNGIQLFENSIDVLDELEKLKKDYVLLTNAPRPNSTVINFLKKMGMSEKKCERVYTSGEAALNHLASNCKNLKFFHIGPGRDFDLFKLFEKNKVNKIEKSDFILCTGLFPEYEQELNYYKTFLKNQLSKIVYMKVQ